MRFFNKLRDDEKHSVALMVKGLQIDDKHGIVKNEMDKLYNQFEIDKGEYWK